MKASRMVHPNRAAASRSFNETGQRIEMCLPKPRILLERHIQRLMARSTKALHFSGRLKAAPALPFGATSSGLDLFCAKRALDLLALLRIPPSHFHGLSISFE